MLIRSYKGLCSIGQISDTLNEKVTELSDQVNQNLARVEANLDKILDGGKQPEGRRRSDRG